MGKTTATKIDKEMGCEVSGGATYTITDPKVIDDIIRARIESHRNNVASKSGNWTPEETLLRHTVVIDYLRQGLSKKRIAEELCLRWGCSMTSGMNYIKYALNYLSEINKDNVDIEQAKAVQLERAQGILESAVERGMYDSALRALDQINKLNGLYTDKAQIDLSGEIKFDFE